MGIGKLRKYSCIYTTIGSFEDEIKISWIDNNFMNFDIDKRWDVGNSQLDQRSEKT